MKQKYGERSWLLLLIICLARAGEIAPQPYLSFNPQKKEKKRARSFFCDILFFFSVSDFLYDICKKLEIDFFLFRYTDSILCFKTLFGLTVQPYLFRLCSPPR
jgi:hypothetical protein